MALDGKLKTLVSVAGAGAGAGAARANIYVPALTQAVCVTTSKVASRSGLQTFEGYTSAGDLVLLTAQATGSQTSSTSSQ